MKTPVKIACYSLGVYLVVSLSCVGLLAHAGLTLAVSISSWVNAGSLLFMLIKNNVYRPTVMTERTLFAVIVASLFVFIVTDLFFPGVIFWVHLSVKVRYLSIFCYVISAIAVYVKILQKLGVNISNFKLLQYT